MAIIASIVGIAATVGSTVYGGIQSSQQADRANRAADAQLAQQKAMQDELQRKQAQKEQQASEQQQQLEARQRAISSGYQNAGSQTLGTSPLGLPGGASSTNGTLLGL